MKNQKKLIGTFTMLITLIIFQSCFYDDSEKISGNGNVVKQDREVSSFNSINASGVFNIYFAQGDKESLVVEADENLIPYLETKVEDNTLFIDVKKHINIIYRRSYRMKLTINKEKECLCNTQRHKSFENQCSWKYRNYRDTAS